MAAATSWQASARGTTANYKTRALPVRDALLSSDGQAANATTTAQWDAALAAADMLIAALSIGADDEFAVQISGSHDGQADESAQPVISVSVQRRTT